MAKQNLSMTRGDTASFRIYATDVNGDPRPFVSGDKVYLTVKQSIDTEVIAIQKIIEDFTDDGAAVVTLHPIDTKKLSYGNYKYDIQLTTATGIVQTIVTPSTFKLTGEVTYE